MRDTGAWLACTSLRAFAQTTNYHLAIYAIGYLLFFWTFFGHPSCPTLLYRMRLSRIWTFAEKRHASQRSGRLDGEDFMTLTGYYAYWTLIWVSPINDWHLRGTRKLKRITKWPVMRIQYQPQVMHLINTRLGAHDNDDDLSTRVRLKVCITWTSTAGLSGST